MPCAERQRLIPARWGEAWVFVDRVMDLGKRLGAGA